MSYAKFGIKLGPEVYRVSYLGIGVFDISLLYPSLDFCNRKQCCLRFGVKAANRLTR